MIMLASQGKLKNIFAGAAAAFFIQSLISVLLGEILVLLPQGIVHLAAGLLFLFFAYSFWKQSERSLDLKIDQPEVSAKAVFLIVFMAEFGDVSQLAIATAAATASSRVSVFIEAVVALWLIAGIALLLGRNLKHLGKPSAIQKAASLAFLIAGATLIFQSLP